MDSRITRRTVVSLVVLIGLVAMWTASEPASPAQEPDAGPSAAPSRYAVVVSGEGFTPSGVVLVVLDDAQGETAREERWIVAGPAVYGPHGSQDPARGYRPGGTFREAFTGLCGEAVTARALDQVTGDWRPIEVVQAGC